MRVFEHCRACHAPCGGGIVTRSMRRVANATLLRFDRYNEPPDSRHIGLAPPRSAVTKKVRNRFSQGVFLNKGKAKGRTKVRVALAAQGGTTILLIICVTAASHGQKASASQEVSTAMPPHSDGCPPEDIEIIPLSKRRPERMRTAPMQTFSPGKHRLHDARTPFRTVHIHVLETGC